jgi:ssDNA-binding replication factor A large subunit
MHKTKTELFSLIADLRTQKDVEKEIATRYKSYEGLVDKDTIAFLLVDELGRNKHSITKIQDLIPNGDYTVTGQVVSISGSKTFTRKNGSPGKVINLEITDDTATCRLVLWNGDIDYVKNKEIKIGTRIKVINGYTKSGYRGGIEINLGRWGLLEVDPIQEASPEDEQKQVTEEITGVLLQKQSTKAFFKDDGDIGFVATITIKEQNIKKEIILWDRCVKEIQSHSIGETLILKNVMKQWEKGKTEFHLRQTGSISTRR